MSELQHSIGEVASATGLPAKTIRYYEDIGLVSPARGENGYRSFGSRDIDMLKFLGRARSLGFSIEDCRKLVSLYRDRERSSADVRKLAFQRIGEIDRKIAELKGLRATLSELARACHGDDRPDCPILDDLSGHADQ